jgi:hypothetical protein
LKPFFQYRHDLYVDSDNFIVFKDRLFIPKIIRKVYLQRLLAMHQAAQKMIARARASIWWPTINAE